MIYCFLGLKHVLYSKKNESWVANYRCVQYRPSLDKKRKGCKCSINIRHSDGEVSTNAELHSSCDEAVKRARLSDITAPPGLYYTNFYNTLNI